MEDLQKNLQKNGDDGEREERGVGLGAKKIALPCKIALAQGRRCGGAYLLLDAVTFPRQRVRPHYTFSIPEETQIAHGLAPAAADGVHSLSAAARLLYGSESGRNRGGAFRVPKRMSGENLRVCAPDGSWRRFTQIFNNKKKVLKGGIQKQARRQRSKGGEITGGTPHRPPPRTSPRPPPRTTPRSLRRALPLSLLLNRTCTICGDPVNIFKDHVVYPPPRLCFTFYKKKYNVDLRTYYGALRQGHHLFATTGWVCPRFPEEHVLCDADFCTWVASCLIDDRCPVPCPCSTPLSRCDQEKETHCQNSEKSHHNLNLRTVETVMERVVPHDVVPLDPATLLGSVRQRYEARFFEKKALQHPHMYYTCCAFCGEWQEWNRETHGGVPRLIVCVCGYEFCTGCYRQILPDASGDVHRTAACARPHHLGYVVDGTMTDALAAKILECPDLSTLSSAEEILFVDAIERAYENGQSMRCPQCRKRYGKDDDSCTQINRCVGCGGVWCYACGRLAPRNQQELCAAIATMGKDMVLPQCLDGGMYGFRAICAHHEISHADASAWSVQTSRDGLHCPHTFEAVGLTLDSFHTQRTLFEIRKVVGGSAASSDGLVTLLRTHQRDHLLAFFSEKIRPN